MSVVLALLRLVVYAFFILLIARFVIDWIRVFAREWRPSGIALVIAETVYTVTDPPLRALRKVIPPLTLGGIRIPIVPPAQIVPADIFTSYPDLSIAGAAMSAMIVTEAPTIPVAAAKSVAVKIVAR